MSLAPSTPADFDPLTYMQRHTRDLFNVSEEHSELRGNILAYVEHIGRDKHGEKLAVDHITAALCSAMEDCHRQKRHLVIVGPPGMGKTTLASLFISWKLGHDCSMSVVSISGVRTVAVHNVSEARSLIDTSNYRAIFPGVIPDYEKDARSDHRGWRQSEFFLQRVGQSMDPTMQAIAGVPKQESLRVDILVADDIVTREISESPRMLERAVNAYFVTWVERRLAKTLGGEGGWCLTLQNPWIETDLVHLLLKDKRFCSLWFGVAPEKDRFFIRTKNEPPDFAIGDRPAEFLAEEVEPANQDIFDFEYSIPLPKMFTREFFVKLEEESRDYKRTYELIAISPKDLMFPSWPSRRIEDKTVSELVQVKEVGGLPIFETGPKAIDNERLQVYGGLDLAGGRRRGDALTFLARTEQHEIFPLIHYRGNYHPKEIVELIEGVWSRGIHFRGLWVENNATQGKILDALKELGKLKNYAWSHRIFPWTTGKNKSDPAFGLPSIDLRFDREIIWPGKESSRRGFAHSDYWLQWELEMQSCPRFFDHVDTPDSPMAMWFALIGLDRGALGAHARIDVARPRSALSEAAELA